MEKQQFTLEANIERISHDEATSQLHALGVLYEQASKWWRETVVTSGILDTLQHPVANGVPPAMVTHHSQRAIEDFMATSLKLYLQTVFPIPLQRLHGFVRCFVKAQVVPDKPALTHPALLLQTCHFDTGLLVFPGTDFVLSLADVHKVPATQWGCWYVSVPYVQTEDDGSERLRIDIEPTHGQVSSPAGFPQTPQVAYAAYPSNKRYPPMQRGPGWVKEMSPYMSEYDPNDE